MTIMDDDEEYKRCINLVKTILELDNEEEAVRLCVDFVLFIAHNYQNEKKKPFPNKDIIFMGKSLQGFILHYMVKKEGR